MSPSGMVAWTRLDFSRGGYSVKVGTVGLATCAVSLLGKVISSMSHVFGLSDLFRMHTSRERSHVHWPLSTHPLGPSLDFAESGSDWTSRLLTLCTIPRTVHIYIYI